MIACHLGAGTRVHILLSTMKHWQLGGVNLLAGHPWQLSLGEFVP